jgi:iron complex outermembrane receptor protein
MNKLFYVFILCSCILTAQNTIKGVVQDLDSKETLIGANIVLIDNTKSKQDVGTATDLNGEFEFKNLESLNYTLNVSYIGYETRTLPVSFDKENVVSLSIELNPDVVLNVINLTGDQAEFRKTPVSLSNVKLEKIEKELAGQEIPMLLNSTPGVYATQQGGGDGDVRINIRGFNQKNVAVMIDGVPMNDMENGWVYWSNWFGLGLLTRSIQVQRGLGASKLALPSVGGTINIITKGLEEKQGGAIKQDIGSGGHLRTSFAYTTKKYKIGKFNFAGAVKKSNGVIDGTESRGLFYYLKWQKEFNNHLFSLSAFGAPQEHNQRKYDTDIASIDKDYAEALGIDITDVTDGDYGLSYNSSWGEYNNYEIVHETGDTIWGENIRINQHKNYYHKPNLNFQHLWNINDRSSLTNVVYYSAGQGGGTTLQPTPPGEYELDENGQANFQHFYDINSGNIWSPFANPEGPSIDTTYSYTEKKSDYILSASINNHYWAGLLSTFNYKIHNQLTLASGIDIRTYRGEHYREVYDLLGGDYYGGSIGPPGSKSSIGLNSNNQMVREGDKIYYHNDGLIRWFGGFSQLEYDNNNITAFINLTGSQSSYKRIDYFHKKDLVFGDTIMTQVIGINDTIIHNGQQYTIDSEEARFTETNWENFPGFTIKMGSNWNIDELNNIFINTGFLSKAPKFNYVFNRDNQLYSNVTNEIIKAIELGYGYRSSIFALNFNAYHTIWENKPQSGSIEIGGDRVPFYIPDMDALHQGIELDFAWKISNAFKYEFFTSIGNWKWTSEGNVTIELADTIETRSVNAKGLYVGDSPQTQVGSSISYNLDFSKDHTAYITLKGVYYDRFFADFNPFDQTNQTSQVWQIPKYTLFSLHCGNTIKINENSLNVNFNILNLFNNQYISDADNNDIYNTLTDTPNSDAASANVFFGLERRFLVSMQYKF